MILWRDISLWDVVSGELIHTALEGTVQIYLMRSHSRRVWLPSPKAGPEDVATKGLVLFFCAPKARPSALLIILESGRSGVLKLGFRMWGVEGLWYYQQNEASFSSKGGWIKPCCRKVHPPTTNKLKQHLLMSPNYNVTVLLECSYDSILSLSRVCLLLLSNITYKMLDLVQKMDRASVCLRGNTFWQQKHPGGYF